MKTTYKKYSKKVLSVFLSLLMVLTSVSVALVSVSAAAGDEFDLLAQALKSDTVKNLSSYMDDSHENNTNKYVVTFDNYAQYAEIADLLTKLDAAIKKTEVMTGGAHDADNCKSPEDLAAELQKRFLTQGYMTKQEIAEYKVATFFGAVFDMNGMVSHANRSTTDVPPKYNVISVTTTNYQGYFAAADSVDGAIALETTLTITCHDKFEVSTGSGCNATKTTYYDNGVSAVSVAVTGTDNGAAAAKVAEHKAYLETLTYDFAALKAMGLDELAALKADLQAVYNEMVAYVGDAEVYAKLFTTKLPDLIVSIDSAVEYTKYEGIAQAWNAFANDHAAYGTFSYPAFDAVYDQMVADYKDFLAIYNQLIEGGQALYEYLGTEGEIVTSYYDNFTDNVVVYDLKAIKAETDALLAQYAGTYQNLAEDAQVALLSVVEGYLAKIGTYTEQVVNAIYSADDIAALEALRDEIMTEMNEYVLYFILKTSTNYTTVDTKTIISILDELPEKLEGLHTFYNGASADAKAFLNNLVTAADGLEEDLCDTLIDRYVKQVDEVYAEWDAAGRPEKVDTYDEFFYLRTLFSGIDDSIRNYFKIEVPDGDSTKKVDDGRIPAETLAKRDAMNVAYDNFKAFQATFGLNKFETSTMQPYAVRDKYANDKIKTGPYEVTEDKLNDVIAKLDEFLASETFADLVGLEGDLASYVNGMLSDLIFSDDLLNTIVGMLYPLIAEYIDQGLIDLMGESTWGTVKGLLTMDSIGELVEAKTIVRFRPAKLAEVMPDFGDPYYVQIKKDLTLAGDNWEYWRIYNENEKKTVIDWGIDAQETPEAKEARFYEAFGVAMVGLSPLLAVLLCDTSLKLSIPNAAILNSGMALDLGANAGYVNALGPIFDILGLTAADGVRTNAQMKDLGKNAANLTNSTAAAETRAKAVSGIVEAIFEPVFNGVNNVLANPVTNVLGILPDLLYALTFNMVPSILKQLKAPITGIDLNVLGFINLGQMLAGVLGDGAELNIGDLLDLEDLLGIDLSKGLAGILDLVGFALPEGLIDEQKLATMGTLEQIDTGRTAYIYDAAALGLPSGKAVTIKANKADIVYYILDTVVGLLAKPDDLKALLGAFLDESKLGIVDKIGDVLQVEKPGDAVAALVEVLTAERDAYDRPDYFDYSEFDSFKGSAFGVQDAFYSTYWTRDMAVYVADNLVPLIENIIDLLGLMDGDDLDIAGLVNDLLGGFFTNENLQTVTGLVGDLLSGLGDDVMDIINTIDPLVNIDVAEVLEAVMSYETPVITDGNRDEFVGALVEFAAPLVPVLKVLLLNENIVLIDGLVTVYGGSGYANGVIPLLEALGCEGVATPDELAAKEGADFVNAILDPILGLLDRILTGDNETVVNNLLEILPNALYFIQSGGLQQAIDNVLTPVYVVLDQIRPLIDVDLTLNLNLEQLVDDLLAGLDIPIAIPSFREILTTILEIGSVETYDSAAGITGKKLVVEDDFTPEFVTVLLRMVVRTIFFGGNDTYIIHVIENSERLSEAAKADLINLLDAVAVLPEDPILFVIYYMFFGVNEGITWVIDTRDATGQKLLAALEQIGFSNSEGFQDYVNHIADLMKSLFYGGQDVPDNGGNIFTRFIDMIVSFFNSIFDAIERLFKIG